ncbi:FHA domain-containing protein [Melittangium boletus]|uniref:Adenylate cyclase n=1 Tax=Melittangium boletus DSM 14713 TaxID=1294270 RepID=A0A250I9J7_9BACT|nr:FHA domain-containing protein [Melittangium boletus]ATB27807.1 adenylate cyclase [Melittangium boletus DSM 14713]
MLKLIIEDDEGRKTVVPFMRDEITIGRQEGNTIRLTERNVSRRHARLLRQNGHVLVEDLGSYNGVRINGERIQGPAQVGDGDLIQIGDYDLALQQEAAVQPPIAPTIRVPSAALQAALEENERTAEDDAEDTPAPHDEETTSPQSADQRRHATAVIRLDQVEANRPRRAEPVPAEEAPHLVVVSPEFKGQEFACISTEMRVGRTEDNDIAIDHRSLSRLHAKIVREDSGEWRVLDMQSANGLSVNGESYAQAPLTHGDLLELGHVKLRFIGPGKSADGILHDGSAKGSRKGLMLGLVGVVVLGGLAGAAWFALGPKDPATSPPVATGTPPSAPSAKEPPTQATAPNTPPTPTAPTLEDKLQSAQKAMDELDFDTAVTTLEALGTEGKRPEGVQVLLDQARGEKSARKSLDQAQKDFAAGKYPEAQKALAASEATLAFATEHTALKQKVEAALKPAEKPGTTKPVAGSVKQSPAEQAKEHYDEGMKLLSKKQNREAEQLFKKCLEVDPTYAYCHMMWGAAVARLGRVDEGAQHYREFLKLAPNDNRAPQVRKLVEDYEKTQTQGDGK